MTTTAGWSTYLIAAADDTAGAVVGISGAPSNPVYLEYGDTPPPATTTVLYRVNAGGPELAAIDASGVPWAEDQSVAGAGGTASTGTPSPYSNFAATGDNTYGQTPTISYDPSVPASAQIPALFQTERYDTPDGTTPANMIWEFDASSGNTYVVNLYFSEIFDTTSVVGGRVFDVYIENDLVLDDYDVYAAAGGAEDTGIMESFVVELADDYITIEFDHLTQNPAIKAIEILAAAEEVTDSSLANGASITTDTEGDDGATPSDTVETTITMPSSGGPYNAAISEVPINVPAPTGLALIGQQSDITITPAAPGAADPFVILFELDGSILPTDTAGVQVVKDGVPVTDACIGGEANPDPCELSRSTVGDDLNITILSTTASTWTFGFAPPVDLAAVPTTLDFVNAPSGSTTSLDVEFTNTGASGSLIVITNPGDIVTTGATEFTASTGEPFPISIDGGESFTVTVDYDPAAPGASDAGSLDVTYAGGDNPTISVPLTGTSVAGPQPGDPILRINAGGALVPATDTGPDWEQDTPGANHPYLAASGNNQAASGTVNPDTSVPSYVPGAIWGTERWSNAGFAYAIPVADLGLTAGASVYVNLYMGNQCACTDAAGDRQFDIFIDGVQVEDNLDLTGTLGHQVGALFQYEIITDDTIDIEFVNAVENPLLNGLEIALAGPQPNVLGISQTDVNFGSVVIATGSVIDTVIITNLGDTGDPTITVSDIQKTLGSTEFILTGVPSLPFPLAPGASESFDVSYDPSDSGFDVGEITITHTGDNGPTSTISLEGEGVSNLPVGFGASGLAGELSNNPTSLEFGPDDRLYVAQQNGFIYAYTVQRNSANNYLVTASEQIDEIRDIQNHNDDGAFNNTINRQVTGLMTAGTPTNPVLYVTSSDWRIAVDGDSGLDTNSGTLSKLTWNGSTGTTCSSCVASRVLRRITPPTASISTRRRTRCT